MEIRGGEGGAPLNRPLMDEIRFEEIRSDWYAANTVLPRWLARAIRDGRRTRLIGFPSIWIPLCVHYGLDFFDCRAPLKYTPIFSEMSIAEISAIAVAAKTEGASRVLLESTAALDAVIADLLYILDHKLASADIMDPGSSGQNFLNTWHSFSRPEIVRLQERMCRHVAQADYFLILPCSRHRPYEGSRTHRSLSRQLEDILPSSKVERVVVTSIGIVPEAFWHEPLVMTYDAGAVDLWRVFQLLRVFFTANRARTIIDCLSFKPYSEMLGLLKDLRVVPAVTRPLKIRWRSFEAKLR